MRPSTDTDAWHTVVLDVPDVPGRRLAETVSGAGFRPEAVVDVGDLQATLEALKPNSNAVQPQAISFTDLQGVVGFPDYWSKETKYQA